MSLWMIKTITDMCASLKLLQLSIMSGGLNSPSGGLNSQVVAQMAAVDQCEQNPAY